MAIPADHVGVTPFGESTLAFFRRLKEQASGVLRRMKKPATPAHTPEEPVMTPPPAPTTGMAGPAPAPGADAPAAPAPAPEAELPFDLRVLIPRAFGFDAATLDQTVFDKIKDYNILSRDPLILKVPVVDYAILAGRSTNGAQVVNGASPLTAAKAVALVNVALNNPEFRTNGVNIVDGTDKDRALQLLAAADAQPALVVLNRAEIERGISPAVMMAARLEYGVMKADTMTTTPPAAAPAYDATPVTPPTPSSTPYADVPATDLWINPSNITFEERARDAYIQCKYLIAGSRVNLTGDTIDRMFLLLAAQHFKLNVRGASVPTPTEMDATNKFADIMNAWNDCLQEREHAPVSNAAPQAASGADADFLNHLSSKAGGDFSQAAQQTPVDNTAASQSDDLDIDLSALEGQSVDKAQIEREAHQEAEQATPETAEKILARIDDAAPEAFGPAPQGDSNQSTPVATLQPGKIDDVILPSWRQPKPKV